MKFLLFCICLASVSANAEVIVNESYDYYRVYAERKGELLDFLNVFSPIQTDGKVFHGNTSHYINWDFQWETQDEQCLITAITVTADITFTLPEIYTFSDEVSAIWNQWYPKLVAHENTHADYAIQTAREIEQSIRDLPSYPDCDQLRAEVHTVAEQRMNRLNQMNKEYDLQTNHGETEGAWLKSYL
ncbi:DUF922 domain-containing Zn-dependent protease [Gynuella sunshinyii]|uniref:DUF922 domain-containing Zn-dependent protease n=1 Tax=Gynuella sunshinyii TaxID=1445505 RepID=UPI00146FD6B8|nr:DUF922 domain-containing protein [Gynuella sunshinyii]